MVKKTLLVLVLAALAAGMAFAQPELKLSAGAGIIGTGNWSVVTTSYKDEVKDQAAGQLFGDAKNSYSKKTSTSPGYDFGGYLFFDATYAEFDVTLGGGKVTGAQDESLDAFKLGLALYGKYPFAIGDSGLTVAPLLGLAFDMVLSATDEFGNAAKNGDKDKGTGVLLYDGKDNGMPKFKNGTPFDFSTLSLRLGAEAKTPMSEKLYLSTQAMWGITFNSAYTEANVVKRSSDSDDKMEVFTHGVTFKVGVGYTF